MILTPEAVMAAGMVRLRAETARHGLTSPQVLATCQRWGAILDDLATDEKSATICEVRR